MSTLSNIKGKLKGVDAREYDDCTACPRCNGFAIVKDNRACGRVIANCKDNCEGCHDYQGHGTVRQRFRCLSCDHVWTVITRM